VQDIAKSFAMAFFASTLLGVHPIPVEIEIDLSSGLPFFQIVGLPDAILRESKTRVKSAILQAGYEFPYDQRVVLNLAPSKVKKEGSGFELGLAARILASSGQIPAPDFNVLFLGELALDGGIRSIPEIEALSFAAAHSFSKGIKFDLIVANVDNLQGISHLGIPLLGVKHLNDFKGERWWDKAVAPLKEVKPNKPIDGPQFKDLKFTEFWAKHLVIAAFGGHHYFLCGPPGCGKTFFAESLKLLLNSLEEKPSIERRLLNAVFQRGSNDFPWAAPHHSASMHGILGGGNPPRAGAITRAHGGILFLDELLEFTPACLDSLREPVEKGAVEIFRAGNYTVFPSRFQIVGATNPCRCGYWKSRYKECTCQPTHRKNYQARLSGPFFDRFDVKLHCRRAERGEKTIEGSEILSQLKDLKKERLLVPTWSKAALLKFEERATKRHFNFRTIEKTKRLAVTLAQIEGLSAVGIRNVAEACELQSFKDLESLI